MLLACRHDDPLSAGLTLAENRADKAQRLRTEAAAARDDDYAAQLRRIADRSARNLALDVRDFVAFEYAQLVHGEQVPDNACKRLHAAVARARGIGPWRPANNGTGKRIWFLYREHPELLKRYQWSKNDRLIRYASMKTAQRAADRLNAQEEL